MSSLASTPGKYKDWNEPLEAMLRATESTLHRLKVNHERYKKSKNKLEAALNAPTYYTLTTPVKENSNSNSNMRNQMNVLPKTTDRMNSIGKADYSSNNNNNEIKNCQSRHSKDYILTETNERDSSYSLHRSSVVNNNISTSASRATSLSASYPWLPQPRKDDIEHSIDDNKPIKGDTMTALSSTMYTPTPVSMSMIRIFQSQLKNLMHEIWKERSEREDSVRNYKEKCENDVEELQLTLRHLTRDVDRIREEHIMEKELQQQQQRESHYNWRNNENDKTKIEKLETQIVQLTEQVQLLVEKSNDMHVMVKNMKREEEEELVSHITNVINEKIETKLQNIFSESTFMSNLHQMVKQEIECFKENSVKPNEEYIVHMIHDAIAEKCNDGLHKASVSIWDAREETSRKEMNAQMNTAAMQHKEELTLVQQQMLNFSNELVQLKEELTNNSLEVNERRMYLHVEQKEECNAHTVNVEECKVIITEMLEPLVLQLTELRNKQQKQELLESECKSDKKDSIDTKSENWVLKFQILQNELHDLKQHVQKKYYTREEVQTCIERLQDKLDEVKQTIDANNNVNTNDVFKSSTEYLEKFTHDAMEKFCTERLKVLLEQWKETENEKEEQEEERLLLLLEKAHAKLQNETRSSINALRSEINETMSERLEEQYANIKTEMTLLHGTVNNEMEEYCNKQSRELTSDIRQEIRNTEQKIGSRHNALKDQVNSLEQQLMETQHELECNREEHKRTSDTHDVYISDLQNDCRTLHDQVEHLSSENALAVSQQRVSRSLEQEVMNYVDKQVEMLDSSHEVEVSELINTLSTVHDSIAQCVSRASQTLEAQSWNKSDKQHNTTDSNRTDDNNNNNKTLTKTKKQQQSKSVQWTKFVNLEEVITFIMEQLVFLRKAAEILQFNSNEMLSIIASHEEEIITGVPLQQHVLGELIKYLMRLQTPHSKFTSQSPSQSYQQQQREQSDFSQRPSSLYTAEVREPSIEPLEPHKQNDQTLQRLLTMLVDAQAQEQSEYMEEKKV